MQISFETGPIILIPHIHADMAQLVALETARQRRRELEKRCALMMPESAGRAALEVAAILGDEHVLNLLDGAAIKKTKKAQWKSEKNKFRGTK